MWIKLDPQDLVVGVIRRGESTLIINTRTAIALTRAGVPRSEWNIVDYTGDPEWNARLDAQLARSGLTDEGLDGMPQSNVPAAALENATTLRMESGEKPLTTAEEEEELRKAAVEVNDK